MGNMPTNHNSSRHRAARRVATYLSFALMCGMAATCAPIDENYNQNANPLTLTAFGSDAELSDYVNRFFPVPRPLPPPPAAPPSSPAPLAPPPSVLNGALQNEVPETVLITGSLIRGAAAVGV